MKNDSLNILFVIYFFKEKYHLAPCTIFMRITNERRPSQRKHMQFSWDSLLAWNYGSSRE